MCPEAELSADRCWEDKRKITEREGGRGGWRVGWGGGGGVCLSSSANIGLIKEKRRGREGERKLSFVKGGSVYAVMDKYRPKRPTTLALFPQLPQAGTQVGGLFLKGAVGCCGKCVSWLDCVFGMRHLSIQLNNRISVHFRGGSSPEDETAVACCVSVYILCLCVCWHIVKCCRFLFIDCYCFFHKFSTHAFI